MYDVKCFDSWLLRTIHDTIKRVIWYFMIYIYIYNDPITVVYGFFNNCIVAMTKNITKILNQILLLFRGINAISRAFRAILYWVHTRQHRKYDLSLKGLLQIISVNYL